MLSTNRRAVFEHITHHAAAYVLATILGALSISPYAYFTSTAPEYAGIAMMGQDAEEHYLARIQEAYEGHLLLGNVFTTHKDTPYLSPGLGEIVIAIISKITGFTVPTVNIATKFFFPALIFLLIYGFGLEVSRSRLAALTGATMGMLGIDIMSNAHEITALLHGNTLSDGITWARPINPQLSGVLLLGGLWQLYRAYTRREHSSWVLMGEIGVLVGISLYLSVYVWSFLGLLLLMLFVYGLTQKNSVFAFKILLAGTVAISIATPFVINYLTAIGLPGHETSAQFQGAITSHLSSLGLWVAVLIALPFLAWRGPLTHSKTYFILCGLSLFIALNQQIISGFYLQPGHYHWYITKPLTGFMLGLAGTLLLMQVAGKRIAILICSIGIISLFTHGALAQQNFYAKNISEARDSQAYAPLFTYLNQIPETSIYTNQKLANYLAIYTHHDAPGSWYAGLYVLPKDYLKKRLFLEYHLRGISTSHVLATLKTERDAIAMQLYGGNWSGIPNNTEALPDTILATLAYEYASYEQVSIQDLMNMLDISYILQDKAVDAWNLQKKGLVISNTINNRFVLYRLP